MARTTNKDIQTAVVSIGRADPDVARSAKLIGYPKARNRKPGFETLMGIVIGQQVSVAAGASIRAKLASTVEPLTPEVFLSTSESKLRSAGLSGRKVEYGLGLAEAMANGKLGTRRLNRMDDEEAIAEITQIRGLGRWSAEIYLMFALRRPDIWPAEDLAVAEALRRLKGLENRPERTESEALVESWRPFRSAGALFLWHFYQGAPT
ncbi:MAG: DNA-3-methyladenine glycosylase II [Verrucomicrobiales bacterium]|jgi:DNA-3-methyladenine glycosylase II